MLIRELDTDERPRERLLTHGSHVLTDVELVSLLLRCGREGVSAIELARELLTRMRGLCGLVGREAAALWQPGIGPGKSALLLAAVEVGRRIARSEVPEGDPMSNPQTVARYLSIVCSSTSGVARSTITAAPPNRGVSTM